MNYSTSNDKEKNTKETFGPAFRQDFLLQAFKLQKDIEKVSVNNFKL